MKDAHATGPSYEWFRKALLKVNKFEQRAELLGELYARQDIRPIGRLHTYYPGQRTELDYTKFGIWLFPNENWNEPLLYFDGVGIDHWSGCIKGLTTTIDPSARDAVRLYRNCVLPKSLWLPTSLQKHAQQWDVFGCEVVVAIDNATDLTANAVMLMFIMNGVIVLRMPVRRGDMKGTIERTIQTLERMFISAYPGYVPREHIGLDPRYKRARERAKLSAKHTVEEYVSKLVDNSMDFNHAEHPRLGKQRIQVWRDGQELSPLILPTGRLQTRVTFSLTYEVKLTREGVEVETLKFNSPELHEVFRTFAGSVFVKLDPDDVRSVLVIVPEVSEPIEAFLTTFDIDFPMTLELLRVLLKRIEVRGEEPGTWRNEDIGYAVLEELHTLQTGPARTPGKTMRSDAQAATHAAAAPPAPPPASSAKGKRDLSSLLEGSRVGDE